MAVVQTYDDKVVAQGQVNSQASGDSFGASVGGAVQNLGGLGMNIAEQMHQNEVADDVTNAHVQVAKKRAEWHQRMQDMLTQTKPGDQTYAPRVLAGLQDDFQSMESGFATRQGQQTFAKLTSEMTSALGGRAVEQQAALNGDFAKNQYNETVQHLGTTAGQDHTQVVSLIKEAHALIDNPVGRFAYIPEPMREAFRRSAEIEIKYDAAKGFARKYPNAVLGEVPQELRTALQSVSAEQPRPGLPPDLKASLVKPFDQEAVTKRANTVAAPSPYDQTFQKAAQLYNMDWRELKMRAVVESNLNPNADSGKAQGIMQFTPQTALQMGVNSKDPVASIFAAAKLVSGYRDKAGGDMSKVDQMYYGGESGKEWGANTKQYAANLAALRGQVGLGTSVSPESFTTPATVQVGDTQAWKKAKTGIDFIDSLPADKFFAVLTDAEQYKRAYEAQTERGRVEQKHQQQVQQNAEMDVMYQRIIKPDATNGGRISEVEVVSNRVLDQAQKQHLIDVMSSRTRELQSRSAPKPNPVAYRDFLLKINADDADPNKLYNPDQLYSALKNNQINTDEFQSLRKEMMELRDGSGGGFRKDVQGVRQKVWSSLSQNPTIQGLEQASPGVAADAAYRFDKDLESQIDALRKAGKDPRTLLDPDSKEYVLRTGRLQKFLPNYANTINNAANNPAPAPTGNALPTYKEYDKLPKGASFTDPQGNVRTKQ